MGDRVLSEIQTEAGPPVLRSHNLRVIGTGVHGACMLQRLHDFRPLRNGSKHNIAGPSRVGGASDEWIGLDSTVAGNRQLSYRLR